MNGTEICCAGHRPNDQREKLIRLRLHTRGNEKKNGGVNRQKGAEKKLDAICLESCFEAAKRGVGILGKSVDVDGNIIKTDTSPTLTVATRTSVGKSIRGSSRRDARVEPRISEI